MAFRTYAVGSTMSHGEGMGEGSRFPGGGAMAGGALPLVMIRRAAAEVTALAVCGFHGSMVIAGRQPGRGIVA